MSAMPIKKPSAGRSTMKEGAPAPVAPGAPPQEQKGMNGSNAAPPNMRGKMPEKKPSAGRTVSMPKHAAKSGGKEAPPASTGGRVGPSRAGESAQPVTAGIAPDVSGGAPAAGTGSASAGVPMAGGQDPQAMIQTLLMQAMQGQGGGQMPGQQPVALPQNIPPELAAMIASAHAGNPELQGDTQNAALADLVRRMMIGSEQQQKPSAILSQIRA